MLLCEMLQLQEDYKVACLAARGYRHICAFNFDCTHTASLVLELQLTMCRRNAVISSTSLPLCAASRTHANSAHLQCKSS